MKGFKKCKKVLAMVLAAGMLLTSLPAQKVEAANKQTLTNVTQVYELVNAGYNKGSLGPISITKGTLKCKGFLGFGWTTKEVYLVTFSGTEIVENQATGLITDLKVGFNCNNPYTDAGVEAIIKCVPAKANIILAGHSLGGMVAQQVAANDTLQRRNNIINTVTFGSPYIAGNRAGKVVRLGDTSDLIPYCSVTGNLVRQVGGLNREDGGFRGNCGKAHVHSYEQVKTWGKYDVVGQKNGGYTLTLDMDTRVFRKAPTNYIYED